MEQHNSAAKSSGHNQPIPALSNNFGGNAFPLHFASTAATSSDNVNSPFFMQTLHHLSALSGATGHGLFPATAGNNYFPPTGGNFVNSEFTNWNAQPSTWLDQAKVAAMLPAYLKTAATGSDQNFQIQTNASSIVERHLKDQAAAAAVVAGLQNSAVQSPTIYNNSVNDKVQDESLTSENGNFFQYSAVVKNSNNVNMFKTQIDSNAQSQMTQMQHYCKTGGLAKAPQKYQNAGGCPIANQPMGMAQSPISNGSPTMRHNMYGSPMNNRMINSYASYPSSSSSHPPSNEGMIESPLSSYGMTQPTTQHQSRHQQHHQEFEPSVNVSPYQYNTYAHQPNRPIPTPKESQLSMTSTITTINELSSIFTSANPTAMQRSFLSDNVHQTKVSNSSNVNQARYHNQFLTQSSAEEVNQHKCGMISASPSTSLATTIAAPNTIENVDDLSTMLDLNEFEDFLNDKDAIAVALHTDPETLLSDKASTSNTSTTHAATSSASISKSTLSSNRKISTPYVPQITSAKMRERIHERRAEELANADKELDRLVSLVAKQNDVVSRPAKFSLLNLDLLGSLRQSNLVDASNVCLNPIQFTPPDSPTNADNNLISNSTISATNLLSATLSQLKESVKLGSDTTKNLAIEKAATVNHDLPSTSLAAGIQSKVNTTAGIKDKTSGSPTKPIQPLVFIPNAKTSTATTSNYKAVGRKSEPNGVKYNRVPIYKQRLQNSSFAARILNPQSSSEKMLRKASALPFNRPKIDEKDASKPKSDAYNFTDDEEEESAMPKSAESADTASTSVSTPKIAKAAANTDVAASNSKSAENPAAIRGRRRQSHINAERNNHFVSVAPAGASENKMHHAAAPPPRRLPSLLETLQRRRDERVNFVRSTDCSRDVDFEADDADGTFLPDNDDGERLRHCGGARRHSTLTCVLKVEEPTATAKTNVDHATDGDTKRALPKLVIRTVKSVSVDDDDSSLSHSPKAKKRKKHKKRERDEEWRTGSVDDASWDGSSPTHHHHHRHHKHHRRHKEELKHKRQFSQASEDPDFFVIHHSPTSMDASFTPRTGLSEAGADLPAAKSADRGRDFESNATASQLLIDERERRFVDERLRCFGRANGALPKGTFLVAKDDVFRADCPLWKIDNQNLLQKYPPVGDRPSVNDGALRYRNSSTYSGWCERIADDYLVLEVRFVKQSRAESIVEPLAPVHDLFPAVASDLADDNLLALRKCRLIEKANFEASQRLNDSGLGDEPATKLPTEWSVDDEMKRHLRTFLGVMLRHVVTMTSLQRLCTVSDPGHEALAAIDRRVATARADVLRRVEWTPRFVDALDTYANQSCVDLEHAGVPDSSSSCQACGSAKAVSTSICFFGPHEKSFLGLGEDESSKTTSVDADDESCLAVEFYVCGNCESQASLYHRNAHLKFYLFRRCEAKLDEMAVEDGISDVDDAIDQCEADEKWTENLIAEQLNLWAGCASSLSSSVLLFEAVKPADIPT